MLFIADRKCFGGSEGGIKMNKSVQIGELPEGKKFIFEGTKYKIVKPAGLNGYYEGLYKLFTTRKNVVLAVNAERKYKYDIYPFEKNIEVEPL